MSTHAPADPALSTAGDLAELRTLAVGVDDPLAAPLLAELTEEYSSRYGAEAAADEMGRYPDADFAPPNGALLVLTRDGEPVAGGAFRRWDADTAEFKRVWTAAAHRRQGYAKRVMAALEDEARRSGYAKVFLSTGSGQPEAINLYRRLGYTLLGREGVDGIHYDDYYAFEKALA